LAEAPARGGSHRLQRATRRSCPRGRFRRFGPYEPNLSSHVRSCSVRPSVQTRRSQLIQGRVLRARRAANVDPRFMTGLGRVEQRARRGFANFRSFVAFFVHFR
jgi:hypothetical protein